LEKRIAVQFYQHSASKFADEICPIFGEIRQINFPFCQMPLAEKSFSSFSRAKVGQKCW